MKFFRLTPLIIIGRELGISIDSSCKVARRLIDNPGHIIMIYTNAISEPGEETEE